ncbi:MAG: NADH:flavin oxidoreductase [Planctomycetia bacterium]|nr:NADH:flavin oxidoreductase [Planctomycetia bacterium]
MARYFKFKSPEEVTAEAAALGHEMRLSADFAPLFLPLAIGTLRAGNRLLVQPMEGCDGTLDGNPDELTLRRYKRFGAGGAKVIWGEATAVCDAGRANSRQLLAAEHTAAGLEQMLRVCRQAHREACGDDGDLVVGLQLTHSGRYSYRKPLLATHDPILDPLTRDRDAGRFVTAGDPLLSDDDLKRIEDQYVAAAKLAARIGYDFVDLKQCHRYLLSELLAARNRPGEYGGSLENRTRLVRNVIGRIRSEVPHIVIATRLNSYDGIPYRGEGEGENFIGRPCPHELPLATAFGTNPHDHLAEDLTEPLAYVRMLRDWGVRLINVSMGNPYSNPHVVRPAEFPPVDGYHAPEHPLLGVARHFRIARQIQAAIPDVPVVGSGYSWLQEFAPHAAAANIAAGHAALAGFGRATLAHPDFAQSLATSGRLNRKQICRTFSYCTALMRAKNHPLGQYPTGCPPFDKEVYGPVWKELEEGRG